MIRGDKLKKLQKIWNAILDTIDSCDDPNRKTTKESKDFWIGYAGGFAHALDKLIGTEQRKRDFPFYPDDFDSGN